MRTHRFAMLFAAAILAASSSSLPSIAAPSVVGTLTCTAEPPQTPSEGRLGGWNITCAFEQVGKKSVQHYGGQIEGLERDARRVGKALLVWNVLASSSVETGGLVGVYKAGNAASLPGRALVGGKDQAVMLQPVNADPSAAPVIDLLQLDLPKA